MSSSFVIVGGGVIGLAVAELISRRGASVTLLEKEPVWAVHQTGHNTGVIHAGPYYAPGSLKAAMCTAGNRSMVQFAQRHGLPHEVCGKLIVAVTRKELDGLVLLHQRALRNGVPCRMLSAGEIAEYEPNVKALGALRVETTGIIDYRAVSRTLADLAITAGAELLTSAAVRAIHVTDRGVTVEHGRGVTRAEVLINCAGLHSDRVAALAGVQPAVRIIPFRGEYYELAAERRHLVRGLIYPVPDPSLPFLGVHLSRGIDGSVHAGPNAVLALAREGYAWRSINMRDAADTIGYAGFLRMAGKHARTGVREVVRSFSTTMFARDLARLVPDIRRDDIVRAGSGVRAQAVLRDGSLADDFIIQSVPRQVHVLNAPSPAATSALEIARHIVQKAESAA
jgi:L-2-hydroxyglutarate oxidase